MKRILPLFYLILGLCGCAPQEYNYTAPEYAEVDCGEKYPEKQTIGVSTVNLAYCLLPNQEFCLDEFRQIHWQMRELSGAIDYLPDLLPFPGDWEYSFTPMGYEELDRPSIKIVTGASDCGIRIKRDIWDKDGVNGNALLNMPVINPKKWNYFHVIINSLRTKGTERIRLVWEFDIDDTCLENIKFDKYGHIDDGTKVFFNVSGITTVTDKYGNNLQDKPRGNGNNQGGGHGGELCHSFDPNDFPCEPIRPTDPNDPTMPFNEESVQVDDECTRVFIRGGSFEAVKPIDNSSCYTDEELIDAIRRGKFTAIKADESAPIPSIMERSVYSNGSFDSNIKWKKPLVYKLVKTK